MTNGKKGSRRPGLVKRAKGLLPQWRSGANPKPRRKRRKMT